MQYKRNRTIFQTHLSLLLTQEGQCDEQVGVKIIVLALKPVSKPGQYAVVLMSRICSSHWYAL